MFKQTIGVEVEMARLTRQAAARVAANVFGTLDYTDTSSQNGYSAWSAYDTAGREWKFVDDVSIRDNSDCRCELVTPILTYDDIDLLQRLIRSLRAEGAVSSPSYGCGVHIHIGADGHTTKTIRNLVRMMASKERLLINAIQIPTARRDRYCQVTSPAFLQRITKEKPSTINELADVWYEGTGFTINRTSHYNNSRYHMLNLHATFTKGTLEFRLFQFDEAVGGKKGGLHAGRLKAFIQLCLAMSHKAKTTKSATARANQDANEKFAMRTWLNRLGMIGDEFKTARRLLTERLQGDTAWRFGKEAQHYSHNTTQPLDTEEEA